MNTRVLTLLVLLLVHLKGSLQVKKGLEHKGSPKTAGYAISRLLFREDFNRDLKNWVSEFVATPASSVAVKNKKLVIDVGGGATVWLQKCLPANIMITFKRKVLMSNGPNDRLSDLNQFWMASDPKHKKMFRRKGEFAEYDSLLLYYAGIGGNSNTTTRFRKYTGDGQRVLYVDLHDREHLLEANKEYEIRIIVYNATTTFYMDGKEFFTFNDPQPLRGGYFGFRTTQSRQEIDDFKVYGLK